MTVVTETRNWSALLWRIGAVGAVVMLAVSSVAWSHVSDRMAVHFTSDGADRFASKPEGLLAIPVTVLLGTVFVIAALRYEKWRRPTRKAGPAAALIWLATVTLLTGIHISLVAIAL
jgi:uncharacterized membrane protein